MKRFLLASALLLSACASSESPDLDVQGACDAYTVARDAVRARREAGLVPDERWEIYVSANTVVEPLCADPAAVADPRAARVQILAALARLAVLLP